MLAGLKHRLPWRKPVDHNKSKKPKNSAWRQQRLRAWKPILTPFHVTILYLGLGLIFIPLGIAILITTYNIAESDSFRYDDVCKLNTTCNITIELTTEFKQPVYFYYRMTWFFQNYRTYVRSRSDAQLRGTNYDRSALADCKPRRGDPDGSTDPDDFYLPCGLQAAAFFNDTFRMYEQNGDDLKWTEEGIAWKSDVEHRFVNPPPHEPGIRVIKDFEDEHFVVWMKVGVFPIFRKLYAIIEQDLSPGKYVIEIDNYYPVDEFDGEKAVVLSEASWIGGRNEVLGISFLVVGGICLALAAYFFYFKLKKSRELADTSYLKWDK